MCIYPFLSLVQTPPGYTTASPPPGGQTLSPPTSPPVATPPPVRGVITGAPITTTPVPGQQPVPRTRKSIYLSGFLS